VSSLLKILFLVLGIALLGVILWRTDLPQLGTLLSQVSWGFALVLLAYLAASVIDAATWLMTIPTARYTPGWLYHIYNVRIAGEAFNTVMPAASMGGEPVKAILLKRYYDIGFRESAASLIMARTINTIALVIFLAIGFAMMLASDVYSPLYKSIAGAGLVAVAIGTALFFAIQRYRVTSWFGSLLSRSAWFSRLATAIDHLKDIDERFVAFYAGHHGKVIAALFLASVNWVLGAVEIYITMYFIGHPISMVDAWIIEAMTQMLRAGTFFIPASIGVQEGVFLVLGSALTGSAAPGLALAAVRRAREIIWVVWGLVVFYVLKPNTEMLRRNDVPS